MSGHWSRSQVTRLVALDVIKGYPDNTYKPDQTVNLLETVALVMRSGGFTTGTASKSNSSTFKNDVPRVPWGQNYLNLAVEKGFFSPGKPESFNYAERASRLEVAKLLAHALYLVPPLSRQGPVTIEEALPASSGFNTGKTFSDVTHLPPEAMAYISAVASSGVMSGYPDGTFRAEDALTRAEMAVILSRLVDRGWVKMAAGRRLEGWVSRIETQKGTKELELTSLSGVQKLRVAEGAQFYQGGEERAMDRLLNYRCEVILDGGRQVSWINLLEPKTRPEKSSKIRGSIKSVALGEDNLLVLNDLNCQDQILPLSWDAVVVAKSAGQGFQSLKPGTFLDAELAGGQVRKATVLQVKTISGTVERFDNRRFYLKEGLTKNRPGWFNHWDRARIVNKDGLAEDGLPVGSKVQITYLDPFPDEIDDEIAIEIKKTN